MSEINDFENQPTKPSAPATTPPTGGAVDTVVPVHHYLRNYGIALLVLTAILVFLFWFFQYTGRPLMKVGGAGDMLSGKYAVEDVAPKAFGDLKATLLTSAPESSAQTAAGENASAVDQKMMAPGIGGGAGISMPVYQNFKFKYIGGDFPALGELQEVYRLSPPDQSQGFMGSLLQVMSIGLMDLNKMRAAKMDYLTFSEERPLGYTFNLDMRMGYISVSQNWQFWPQPPTVCDQNYCGPVPRLKPEDLPTEEQAIAIADKFFADYGLSKEGLGKPYLDKTAGGQVRPMAESSVFIPDQQFVIYPKLIEGRTVYNENGSPEGLQVAIDVRQKAVAGVYGIARNQYQRSLYPGETDRQKIIDVVNRGGFRNYVYDDPNAQEVVLQVDTPTVGIVSMWYNQPGSNYSEQLYVNSLLFPVKDAEKQNYWRQYLVVPLVKEVLESDQQTPPIMPMVKEGGSGAVPEATPLPAVQSSPAQ